MKRNKQSPRALKGKRHAPAEQDRIITLFDAARERGLQPAEAIKGLGASRASVYRWKRDRDPSHGMPSATVAQEMSIDDAIARLVDTFNTDRLSFLEALFKFITWLRWPTATSDHPAAITICVISYLSKHHGAITADQLDSEDRELLFRHLRLDILSKLFSDYIFAMPSFELWKIDNQKYTELDVLGHLAWFIVAYKSKSDDHRDAVSLNKAHYVFQNNLFGRRWKIAHRTFRSFWVAHGASAPFHYVERFHPTLEFTLDPASNDFSRTVDELLQRRVDLRSYMARCRTVTDMICRKFDRRAIEALHFPHFPNDLEFELVTPPPLPILTDEILKGFGRGDKR
ncbi:hypothetical protein [Methylobacterium sp. GC_Met_2]|uniref:hypothetical protein n=1 Tax=Methylobacterium sp. GC_Met_2 TaxID=2937376 RepID=UPI00226B3BEE|nr:hypothetical protein [Methylobacterium sp. GC_Met_2]